MHVVCPKFLAFKGPLRPGHPCKQHGEVAFSAGHYAKMFRTMGVRAVVRLFHPVILLPACSPPFLFYYVSSSDCMRRPIFIGKDS